MDNKSNIRSDVNFQFIVSTAKRIRHTAEKDLNTIELIFPRRKYMRTLARMYT